MVWTQNYDPGHNIWISSAVAALPIVFFFLALTVLKMKGHMAAFFTVLIALTTALIFYQMPAKTAIGAAGYGAAYSIWPIAYIVLGAVFLYKLTVKSGQFEVIRASIVSLTDDPRLQVLIVGFIFNSFLEGAAGFGAPIAITAALLVGLGFDPVKAAGLCLIANIAPGSFGAMGIPIIVAGQVTGIAPHLIAAQLSTYMPYISFTVPFLIVVIMSGFQGVKKIWRPTLVTALSYSLTQWVTIRFIGPELPDITSAIVALICLATYLKLARHENTSPKSEHLSVVKVLKGWSPFILLTLFVLIWCSNGFKQLFTESGILSGTTVTIPFPWLHNMVLKGAPLVPETTLYPAILKLDFLSATGTAIACACITTMVLLKIKLRDAGQVFVETVKELIKPILTIMFVLSFAFIANYSGESATLGIALAHTARYFPAVSPILGWLGVFLTGSVVSANALFGGLQHATANQIGVLPLILITANVGGGTVAKMLSPQSIAVATGAVGLAGKEGILLRFTIKYSVVFLVIVCAVAYVQSII
ncbi:lactate permease LctP family transporter [Sporolactobacillus kofuensis]|uniref:L-lactate permease n=1 Tax=Sporolactobacillus kofuensis TaxID=269672 RepID=A0ABW1WEJ3_9BACL|nr:lactate permease LctP family transporter [Sporolactobacillus kofuensis]MCO7175788.1 lactate permease LctP family transporter [Sporolactobacillus kofuensis]